MGNKRLFPLLEFSRQPVFPHWQIALWAWWNGLPHWCTLTSNPAQPAQCTGRQIMPQMRSSACLSDRNFLCPRRTVPICIRQTFDEGVQERLDTSHSESNSSLERLKRKKKRCLEHSSVYEPYNCFSPTIWIQLPEHSAAEVREWTHFPNEHH